MNTSTPIEFPEWVWEVPIGEDETEPIAAFAAIHEVDPYDLVKLASEKGHRLSGLRIKDLANLIEKFSTQAKLPPRGMSMSCVMSIVWMKLLREEWISQNPFPKNHEEFKRWKPFASEPAHHDTNIQSLWEKYFEESQAPNFNPAPILKQLRDAGVVGPILKDWEKLRKWKVRCIILPEKELGKIHQMFGWTIHPELEGDKKTPPLIVRAAHLGLLPDAVQAACKATNHPLKNLRTKEITDRIGLARKRWGIPPAANTMSTTPGRRWATEQLKAWGNLNPFPENLEQLERWTPTKGEFLPIAHGADEEIWKELETHMLERRKLPSFLVAHKEGWADSKAKRKILTDWWQALTWQNRKTNWSGGEEINEKLCDQPETQQADPAVWEPIITGLVKSGKTAREIWNSIQKNRMKVAEITPSKPEFTRWEKTIRRKIEEDEKTPKPPIVVEPPKRKTPTIFGASCGSEFANIPGWTIPEYQLEEGITFPEKATYPIWGRLLMYGILNFWTTSKIERFIREYGKIKPHIPTPDEETLQSLIRTALADLQLPPLKEGDSRESEGYNKAILLWKGKNKFPTEEFQFKTWKPADCDYSQFSFEPE